MSKTEHVHYIIVVHGIGEQRKNETVIEVVNRFAEARFRQHQKIESTGLVHKGKNTLTLGKATGQTGKGAKTSSTPWLEYEGIPINAEQEVAKTFQAEKPPLKQRGSNVRFVDMWWADVMQNDIQHVGQAVEPWTDGLLARLENKKMDHHGQEAKQPPRWALMTVQLIKSTVGLLSKLLNLKSKDLGGMIFNDFLGDVQLYGEYSHCRGQGVARFHQTMENIEQALHQENLRRRKRNQGKAEKDQEPELIPRYHIVAHSLGTVMSMDALLYAHAKRSIREGGDVDVRNMPFGGYKLPSHPEKEGEEQEQVRWDDWILKVESWITLGSPIDKYLTLWWQNYRYLNADPEKWIDPRYKDRKRIRHYNYCEEQDPVGHNLDLARTSRGFPAIFQPMEDIVYIRDMKPGAAHMAYWRDLDLFDRILSATVDSPLPEEQPPAPVVKKQPEETEKPHPDAGKDRVPGGAERPTPVRWFIPEVYKLILFLSYDMVPFLVILLDFAAFGWMWTAESITGVLMGGLAFLIVTYLGARILDLSVMWRQITRLKRPDNLDIWCVDKAEVDKPVTRFNRSGYLRMILFTVLGCCAGFAYAFYWKDQFPYWRFGLILLVISALMYLGKRFLHDPNLETQNSLAADDSRRRVKLRSMIPVILVSLSTIFGLFAASQWREEASYIHDLEEQELLSEFFQTDGTESAEGIEEENPLTVEDRLQPIVFYLTVFFTIAAVVTTYRKQRFLKVKEILNDPNGKPLDKPLDFKIYAE